MKTINLNKSADTVFVGDVDVAKGVYATYNNGMSFVFERDWQYFSKGLNADNHCVQKKVFNSLYDLAQYYIDLNLGYQFFTIPDNRRIVLEKEIGIENLTDNMHVGFVDNQGGDKGYCQKCADKWILLNRDGHTWYGYKCESQLGAVKSSKCIQSLYTFPTRKDLYKWLSE